MASEKNYVLSTEELVCLSTLCGFERTVSLDNEIFFFDDEPTAEIRRISKQLADKKYISEDFDGNFKIKEELELIIALFSEPQLYWICQSTLRGEGIKPVVSTVYHKDGNSMRLDYESEEGQSIWMYEDLNALSEDLVERFLPLDDSVSEESLTPEEVSELPQGSESKLINITKYRIDGEQMICENMATLLSLENRGSYLLSVNEEDELYKSADKTSCVAALSSVLSLEVDAQ